MVLWLKRRAAEPETSLKTASDSVSIFAFLMEAKTKSAPASIF